MSVLDYSLYLATDRACLAGRDLPDLVDRVLAAGVTMVQLRDKEASTADLYAAACAVHAVTQRRGVPLIINDRVDVMLAMGAEGVHIGRSDLPLDAARRLAAGRILGYSVNTSDHLDHAVRCGADYVGVGPVFATGTKSDTAPVIGVRGLAAIVSRSSVPCVAIGGIRDDRVAAVMRTGAAGICVISAILGQADPEAAARRLRSCLDASRT